MAATRMIVVMACTAVLTTGGQAASILFPDQTVERTTRPRLVFNKVPDCAKNSDRLCAGPNIAYPTQVVKAAIARSDNAVLTELTRGDQELPQNTTALLQDPLGVRFGGSVADDVNLVEETAACTASESIIYPMMAENAQLDWLFVVNIKDHIVQGIRVEKCVEENKPCKFNTGGTVCRQKYIYRKLLAINGEGTMAADNFRIPSACVCYIKNDFLGTRFNDKNSTRGSDNRTRRRRQADRQPELEVVGGETEGLRGSPLDNTLAGGAAQQGSAQQSIETEDTLNPSDTIGGQPVGRFAGEIVVHSNPIVVQKKPPKASRRRN